VFTYYRFVGAYKREPHSWDDLFDGIRADNALREIVALPWKDR
jgi:hypothetical protein